MDYFFEALLVACKLIITFDEDIYAIVFISLVISLSAVIIASAICIPLGLIISSKNFAGKGILQGFLNTLMALPTVVVGLLLYGLLNRNGILGQMLWLYTPIAIIIGQCMLIIPLLLNLVIIVSNSADPRIHTASQALGANRLQQGIIFIGEIKFSIMVAIITAFGRAIGEVGIAMMVGGNIEGYTRTMTTAIALETSKGDFGFALALGIILLIVSFLVNYILYRFEKLTP